MGLQEGLLLLGGSVFLLILLDALRRKRAAARRRQEDDYEDPEEQARREVLARELPNLDDPSLRKARKDLDPLFDDIDVFDDDPIPVLRKSVQLDGADTKAEPPATAETPLTADQVRRLFERDPGFTAEAQRSARPVQAAPAVAEKKLAQPESEALDLEPPLAAADPVSPEAIDDLDDLVDLETTPTTEIASESPASSEATLSEQPAAVEEPAAAEEELLSPAAEAHEREQHAARLLHLEQQAWGEAEEFLTININARSDLPFEGHKLAYLMDMIGMQLSDSGFFHYVVENPGQPTLGYSMVNMYAPGNFSEDQLNDYVTSGVVLAMALPNARKPQAVFERMLETARVFERNWGAELQDEQRSNLTLQTIEHYRQRIQEFERKTRLKEIKAQKARK